MQDAVDLNKKLIIKNVVLHTLVVLVNRQCSPTYINMIEYVQS